MSDRVTLVAGAGGFIGGSLVADFSRQGHKNIRAVDVKPLNQWYQKFYDVENLQLDLKDSENCELAARYVTLVNSAFTEIVCRWPR
jgi:GDP-D-mannose 3',5'-epimerase